MQEQREGLTAGGSGEALASQELPTEGQAGAEWEGVYVLRWVGVGETEAS